MNEAISGEECADWEGGEWMVVQERNPQLVIIQERNKAEVRKGQVMTEEQKSLLPQKEG